jgi:DNA-binding IclR family transcriptional regulator
VRAADGTVVAAVSVSGPTARITAHATDRIGALLVTETHALSAILGHEASHKEHAA